MAGLRGALAAAVMTSGVLLGAVACGGSSTVEAPTTPVEGEPTSLPATAPGSATAPSGYPGASSAANTALTQKDKDFIAKVRQDGVKAPDDVVINAAQFACEYDKSGRDAKNLEPFVVGILGPYDGDAASGNAKKFITEARASYCKK
ncbi:MULTISPECIES: DUF732 domain-containing protein [Tsukamurella]|uniref:DUF732 domain-containing protein n=2 Tax=Tsukamurella TaxID=2060 RepID=A0A5C5RV20_9ACTN|nr:MULTISPECIES: DUF732 domain-containing protein [Tsukamurella]NMD57929.1 DUF732 domain-containing protein [Tsukamurella columbiensis]TWS26879.1 DUF732 domain-containing protein [Tsukamurella conjunctivitidis]